MTRAELDIGIGWAADEGWNPGLHDADSFYATDPGGFLIGRLRRRAHRHGVGGEVRRRLRLHRLLHRASGLARPRSRAGTVAGSHGPAAGPADRSGRRGGAAGQLPAQRLPAGLQQRAPRRHAPAHGHPRSGRAAAGPSALRRTAGLRRRLLPRAARTVPASLDRAARQRRAGHPTRAARWPATACCGRAARPSRSARCLPTMPSWPTACCARWWPRCRPRHTCNSTSPR